VIVNGNVLDTLPHIPDESIHLTFTSPPYYNARDYSIYSSYQVYLEFLAQVFNEVHRITKEGRFLIVNTSPVIVPRISRAHSSQRYAIPFDLHPYLVIEYYSYHPVYFEYMKNKEKFMIPLFKETPTRFLTLSQFFDYGRL
jgi:DNA modification methylase